MLIITPYTAYVLKKYLQSLQHVINYVLHIRRVPDMREYSKNVRVIASCIVAGLPLLYSSPAFAATAGVTNVESFIKSVITVLAGLAGLIATGFFVVGGFSYITSSGNPEHLDRAKRTIMYSAIGLSVVVAAFVISNIVTTLATNAFGS
jgi:Type IV secretion system pilin